MIEAMRWTGAHERTETTMYPNFKQALYGLAAASVIGALLLPPALAQTAAKPPGNTAKPADNAAKPADAAAKPGEGAMTADAAAVKKLLEQRFPGAQVTNVGKSGYLGLYEAQFDGQMVYTDAKVAYVLVGSIYDATSKQN